MATDVVDCCAIAINFIYEGSSCDEARLYIKFYIRARGSEDGGGGVRTLAMLSLRPLWHFKVVLHGPPCQGASLGTAMKYISR